MSKSCPKTAPPRRTSEGGFSLVEVLVSIVVLSFGMLGMVGLQAAALQANRDARAQSAAVTLARELAEMIRGNKEVGIKTTLATNPYLGDFTSPLAPANATYCLGVSVSASASCTSIPIPTPTDGARVRAIANAQMTEWLNRVEAELPAPHVVVCYDSTPFDAAGLPQWACSGTGGTAFVKIGWTRGSTKKDATGSAAFERATVPSLVLPVISGSDL